MTGTESYNGVARRAATATERSAQIWKQGAHTIAAPVQLVTHLPAVDLTRPVSRYFEYLQGAVDLNRTLATAWAETVTSLFGVVREHAQKVADIVTAQTETVLDVAREQAEKTEQGGEEQASRTRQAGREQARQRARERYAGMTKAELSGKLAERALPKTGTVGELIERLVSADTE